MRYLKLLSRLAKAIYASPEIKVYEKVINHAEVCASTAKALREAIDAAIKGDMPRDLIERVYELEKQADVLRRQILDDLAKGGLPPLTREDFVRLAERVDKVADWSKEAARLIKASQGLSLDDELKALVRSLAEAEVKAANLLHRALTEMQSSYDSALSIIKEKTQLGVERRTRRQPRRIGRGRCQAGKPQPEFVLGSSGAHHGYPFSVVGLSSSAGLSAAPPALTHASTSESLNFHRRPILLAGSPFVSIQR